MSIIYDRYKFLEFFDSERVIDEEIEDIEYTLIRNGICFKLHIMTYDEYASITLKKEGENSYFYNIGLERITKIKFSHSKLTNELWLNFYQENNIDHLISILIKPNFSFTFRIK